jgi:hypothetical protein
MNMIAGGGLVDKESMASFPDGNLSKSTMDPGGEKVPV